MEQVTQISIDSITTSFVNDAGIDVRGSIMNYEKYTAFRKGGSSLGAPLAKYIHNVFLCSDGSSRRYVIVSSDADNMSVAISNENFKFSSFESTLRLVSCGESRMNKTVPLNRLVAFWLDEMKKFFRTRKNGFILFADQLRNGFNNATVQSAYNTVFTPPNEGSFIRSFTPMSLTDKGPSVENIKSIDDINDLMRETFMDIRRSIIKKKAEKVFLTPKYDGHRCLVFFLPDRTVRCLNRKMIDFFNVIKLSIMRGSTESEFHSMFYDKEFLRSFGLRDTSALVFDCEYVHSEGNTLRCNPEKLAGITPTPSSTMTDKEDLDTSNHSVRVFGIYLLDPDVPIPLSQTQMIEIGKRLIVGKKDNILYVEPMVLNATDLYPKGFEFFNKVLSDGAEGIVAMSENTFSGSPLETKSSSSFMYKIKPIHYGEARLTAITKNTGGSGNTYALEYFNTVSNETVSFGCMGAFDDETSVAYFENRGSYIGKLVNFKAGEVSLDRAPKFATVLAIKDDTPDGDWEIEYDGVFKRVQRKERPPAPSKTTKLQKKKFFKEFITETNGCFIDVSSVVIGGVKHSIDCDGRTYVKGDGFKEGVCLLNDVKVPVRVYEDRVTVGEEPYDAKVHKCCYLTMWDGKDL